MADVRLSDNREVNEMNEPIAAPTAALSWGRHYVMVEPTHFRIDYAINPFMDLNAQPDPERAMVQWRTLVATLRGLGARVDVLPQRADAPDMVYAMNLGLAVVRPDGGDPHVVMSHMRFAQRRMETGSAQPWFAERGWTTSYVGRDGVGAHLEAGDARSPSATASSWATAPVPRSSPSSTSPSTSGSGSAAFASPTRRCTTSTSRSARSTSVAP